MAEHTMQLQHVIAARDRVVTYGRVVIDGINYGSLPILSEGSPIGLEDYPLHREDYRPVLNGKIIDQYYLNEIAHESIGVFIHRLRLKMNEIMPYYAKMYQDITFEDAMNTTDIRTMTNAQQSSEGGTVAESETQVDNKSGTRAITQNFPQTALSGNADYADTGADTTGYGENAATVNEKRDENASGVSESESHSIGRAGSAADALMAYRAVQLNVDRLIIAELKPLFMGVYGTGGTFYAPIPTI